MVGKEKYNQQRDMGRNGQGGRRIPGECGFPGIQEKAVLQEGGNSPLVSNTTTKVMKMNPKKYLLNVAPWKIVGN